MSVLLSKGFTLLTDSPLFMTYYDFWIGKIGFMIMLTPYLLAGFKLFTGEPLILPGYSCFLFGLRVCYYLSCLKSKLLMPTGSFIRIKLLPTNFIMFSTKNQRIILYYKQSLKVLV